MLLIIKDKIILSRLHVHSSSELGKVGLSFESLDETSSGRIVRTACIRSLELLLNVLSKNLTQLNAPLVERVDVPDGTLGECQVLVESNESSQGSRGDLLGEDGSGWSVTKESLMRHQGISGILSLDLLGGLSDHQSFGLSEEVGSKHALVLTTLNRVVRLDGKKEVGRDELCALVKKLEETVLGVGGGFTEQDRTGGVLDIVTRASDGLSVALHRQLLEVGGESVEVLVKWRDQVSLSAKEVTVPDTQKTSNDGNVLLQRSLTEVLVQGMSTRQELVEVVVANVYGNGKTDGAPDRVTSTNPRFEFEHVLLVDTELGDLNFVGGQGDEVLSNVSFVLGGFEEPLLGRVGVGSGLGSSESLGSDQEEGGFRVGIFEGFGDVSTVDVGHKVEFQVGVSIGLQGLGDHDWAAAKGENYSWHSLLELLTDLNHQYQC